MTSWRVEHLSGSAGELHARPLPEPAEAAVWVFDVDRPALVLGSTQPESVVDRAAADAAGVGVVRRRSGGGAVLMLPGEMVWVDVVVPTTHARWDDDVGRAFLWVGETWRAAVAGRWPTAEVHRGALQRTRWSELACFAGRGPGEVSVAGAKAVGLSQRRTRTAARFQGAVHLRWRPDRLADLLALTAEDRSLLVAALTANVVVWPGSADELTARFLAALDASPH